MSGRYENDAHWRELRLGERDGERDAVWTPTHVRPTQPAVTVFAHSHHAEECEHARAPEPAVLERAEVEKLVDVGELIQRHSHLGPNLIGDAEEVAQPGLDLSEELAARQRTESALGPPTLNCRHVAVECCDLAPRAVSDASLTQLPLGDASHRVESVMLTEAEVSLLLR